MTPLRDIKPEDIRGVVYLDRMKKGRLDGVRLILVDGTTHTYHGDDLPLALRLAKERFPAEPGSTRMSDRPFEE